MYLTFKRGLSSFKNNLQNLFKGNWEHKSLSKALEYLSIKTSYVTQIKFCEEGSESFSV